MPLDEAKNEAIRRIQSVRKQQAEVLDLGDLPVGELPEELGMLTWLRFLSLGKRAISVGPTGVENSLKYDRPKQTFLSLSPLARLANLEYLDLTECEFGGTVSDLARLTSLRYLVLEGCWQVRDISPLTILTGLRHVDFSKTGIRDFSALGKMTAMRILALRLTEISNLAPLVVLTELQRLDLTGCRNLMDVSPLAQIGSLEILSLRHTKVRDISALRGLAHLKQLDWDGPPNANEIEPFLVAAMAAAGAGVAFGAVVGALKVAVGAGVAFSAAAGAGLYAGGRILETRIPLPRDALKSLPTSLQYKTNRRRSAELEVDSDLVDASVFAPPRVPKRGIFLIQVFAHTPDQTETAKCLAQEFDSEAERRGFKSLEMEIPRRSMLAFHLVMAGLEIDDPRQTLMWQGRPESVQFKISVPDSCPLGATIGTVIVSQDSIPLGHVKFKLNIVESDSPEVQSEPVGEKAAAYRKAFISYASQDRKEVLKRVQMLVRLKVDFFQDLLSLEPGDRWEQQLYREIDECDLFLLFWSSFAKKSQWVMKEIHYALGRKGTDESAPPAILPVIIEGPPPVAPPPELSHLHFNDYLIYLQYLPSGTP